ncbi:MAG: DNA repair protein RadC [Haemophilus parainfluenzae]|nr:DNA repair protein RadC [Haemophilus parainfluenzae]
MQTNTPLMPREKLLKYGVEALEDHELLAIFLRTGIKKVKGLGITQFIQLQATTEMTKRYLKQELLIEHVFSDTSTVKLYLQAELHHEEREIFMVLFLDNQHRLIKKERLFLGTINVTNVYPREIIKESLSCNAAALILAHNHPSGLAEPSYSDKMITQKIIEAAELMDIRILDHFIVGKGTCYLGNLMIFLSFISI